jgi:uncharacterized protein with NRDE domain
MEVTPALPADAAANRDGSLTVRLPHWVGGPTLAHSRRPRPARIRTWLGAARSGRFGVVANFRELERPAADAPSRGDLVRRFLSAANSPQEYFDDLRDRAPSYTGFNLLLGGSRSLYYYSNRDGLEARPLGRGIYGLSNHWLDSPWPKLLRTRTRLSN